MLYEVFVLASISCKEGVACSVQFCMKSLFRCQSVVGRECLAFNINPITVLYEVLVLASISCKEGVSSIQYFITIHCFMKSLFCRQSDVGRVCLAFNTLSQYSAI